MMLCSPFHDENQVRLFMKIKRGAFEFQPKYWSTISNEAKVCVCTHYLL
jgi:hypothetical protein